MEKRIRIKTIQKGSQAESSLETPVIWGNCEFWISSDIEDYDWVIVYDEIPKNDSGTIHRQKETLACHPDHTLLVTVEPPSIKLYTTPYTKQFGVVVSTHPASVLPHKALIQSGGALHWFYGKELPEILQTKDIPKTKTISTVCSAKQQSHTLHSARYQLTKAVSDAIPELEWYGRGVRPMNEKFEAMDDYKYHIAIENYIGEHHWTEKLADCFLALCLPFYVGDKSVLKYFPEDSVIFIPIDDPEQAVKIIKEAIENNEYEKRLPALKEARRRILEEYNFWAITSKAIEARHDEKKTSIGSILKGRHSLRKNPINLIKVFCQMLRYKLTR